MAPDRRPSHPEETPEAGTKLEEADQLLAGSRWQEVLDLLGPVMASARARGDLRTFAASAVRIGHAHTRMDNRLATGELLREALAAAENLGDPTLAVDVLRALGGAHYRAGDLYIAQEFLEEAVRIAEDAGLDDRRAGLLVDLGNQAYERQSYGDAEGRYRAALAGSPSLEDRLRSLCNLALTLSDAGRFAEAASSAEEARALARDEWAYPHLFDAATGILGRSKGALGQTEEALRLIDETVPRATARGDRLRLTNAQLWRGEIMERLGRWEEAMACFKDAHLSASERASAFDVSEAALGIARLAQRRGDYATARRYANEALANAERAEGKGRIETAKRLLASLPPSG